ncbi:carbohydrate binding family 9 domain-containing protein [Hymenobacter sp. BT683]|uniref:Carbohydrate binding family 9 domain-containing protein n=1 Tax=Hymenobacter jeongseonensis TaxID=2791027 RepID=A0ABS0IGP0_9BACT|nr:DUF5916 domain-containing protein [Hymenobacter jeongseonensis]MBF9236960.1 carbohydrate binding family 9 domain-containing protein [Hymenobacter jeongseonensis]
MAQAPAADKDSAMATLAPKRQLAALRMTQPIKLDGVLDEAVWREATPATDFIQNRPNPGPHEKFPTEVRVLYDDAAIYIGAVMHDVSTDSIPRELTDRDNFGNTDFFGVFFDTYQDKLNGYAFFVTTGGVQMDARYSPASGEDFAWNAVWESRTTLQGTDWVAEMRIPYSALRFSTAEIQQWGLNFMRQRKRENQAFFWNEVRPGVDGFVNQWGVLTGLRDLKPPLRLSLTPYVSSYVNHFPFNEQGKKNTSTSFNGGADVKWGINESFTLDATLVPDFGQVQSDNQVLNLSPFEVQFNENRQFFTEGTELFNKGGLFYSRRVGATPIGFGQVTGQLRRGERQADGSRRGGEFVVENPGVTRLLNATKVSGRTSKGLGVGVFNALSNDVYATVQDSTSGVRRDVLTQPFANYSIVVLDQSLKNNSFVSLINTNVTRAGSTYDANVTGGLFRFANKKNAYAVDGRMVYSRRRGTSFGSERQINDQDGYKYSVGLGKISGNLTWSLNHGIESDTYNPNDLGILFGNNNISQSAQVVYQKFKPFWKVNNFAIFGVVSQTLLYKPTRYQAFSTYLGANTTFTKSFIQTGFDFNLDAASHDFFEPRSRPLGDYYVRVPGNARLVWFMNSDSRKKFAYGLNAGMQHYNIDDRLPRPRRTGYSFGAYPRFRVNDHLTFRYSIDWSLAVNQIGYVNGGLDGSQLLDQPIIDLLGGDFRTGRGPVDALLGRRNVATVSNVVSTAYTFTNRMAFTLRVRHYTSNVHYNDFAQLRRNGEEQLVAYQRNRDNTYNAFNVDAVYSWWFAPGSQISVVWKNASADELFAERATPQYFDNFNSTINTPHNNSVSVKVLYYLDYLNLRRKQ